MTELGPMGRNIERKLRETFAPSLLAIEDESARHAGHAGASAGGESHFRVRIISDMFNGISRLDRQRRITALLKEEFAAGLHALSIEARTPAEMTR